MRKKDMEKALDIYDRYITGQLPETEKEKKLLQKFLQYMTF